MPAATMTTMTASTTKTPCQPSATSVASVGNPPSDEPIAPNVICSAITSGSRSALNQRRYAVKGAISPIEAPTPIRTRPMMSCQNASASAKTAHPTAASRSTRACTRRAPKRSISTPRGTWLSAKPTKKTLVRKPRSAAVRPRSALIGSPATAFTTRRR